MIRKIQKRLKDKSGTTLVEMLVTLLLVGIMLSMATAILSSASKVFLRVQKTQYAQSILDTVMTELRTVSSDAVEYVKIYENGADIAEKSGKTSGNAIEFINSDSFVELVTTEVGADSYLGEVKLYDSDKRKTDVTEKMNPGQIYTRYYTTETAATASSGATYIYSAGTYLVARAIEAAYGEGFYMGNYVKVTYSVPEGTQDGDSISSVNATVALYSDKECTEANKVAEDTEPLYFRNPVKFRTSQTAIRKALW